MPALEDYRVPLRATSKTVIAVLLVILVGSLALTDLPERFAMLDQPAAQSADHHEGHDHDSHEGHDHAGHSAADSVEVSAQARVNMALRTAPVSVGTYVDYIEVPGVITNWPGRTHIAVTSPLTGVLNSILVSRGELVASGTPLFTLRLTHQDLVNTQETFLAKLGELDVEEREIERLSSIARSGAIPGKTLITRKYERDKLLAAVRAARQAMLLHGLTEEQIVGIERSRELVREVTIYVPAVHEDQSLHHDALGPASARLSDNYRRYASLNQPPEPEPHPGHLDVEFLVTELNVRRGQAVSAGDELAQLSDYSKILIEGHAFQRDAKTLRAAADSGADVQAVMETANGVPEVISGLKVVWIGTEVGRTSRALPFYVAIENQPERYERRGEKRYVSWLYKPGQRLTVRLPVAKIENAIVVPKDAVAEEGSERFVFVENGDHFDRVSVAVLARDSVDVAIANDGQLWPGQSIAIRGAHQLQMALKNRAGGAVDPHAGHNH